MPEIKPSKAAMEVILYPFHVIVTEQQYQDAAAVVDEHVGDLLEKAQTLNVYIEARWGDTDATIQGLNRPLAAALEPWRPK